MDLALPVPAGIDRRLVVRLALVGAVGAALADTGIVTSAGLGEGPQPALDSLRRTLVGIAADYDTLGPRRVAIAAKAAEASMLGLFGEYLGGMPSGQEREAKVVYSRLLTVMANALADIGNPPAAAQAAGMAVSFAIEVGDNPSAAHAMLVTAGLSNNGRRDLARIAQAAEFAGASPVGVMAAVVEAQVAAGMGDAHRTLEAVQAAEAKHERLPATAWGNPGYSLGTYHPANLKAHGGAALAGAGLYSEATPRLEEAADLARGTGLMVYIMLSLARVRLGAGDVDTAHAYAARAVEQAEDRPAAWVADAVTRYDRLSRGAFADLAERAAQWQFPATT
jgi:hypothetical protein